MLVKQNARMRVEKAESLIKKYHMTAEKKVAEFEKTITRLKTEANEVLYEI